MGYARPVGSHRINRADDADCDDSSAGTVTIPKQFRKHMDMQKGDYVKISLKDDSLIVKKTTIT